MLRIYRERVPALFRKTAFQQHRKFAVNPVSYNPWNMHTEADRVAGVLQDIHLFEYIPVEKHTENLYLAATWHPIFNLESLKDEQLTFDLCRYAVQYNARQIDKVPARHLAALNQWLSQVRTLVVRNGTDNEVKQFTVCYVRADEHKDTTLCIDAYAVEDVLKKLQSLGVASLELTFISHSGPTTYEFVGHTPENMTTLLARYPFINAVTLLGCNTVVSQQLEAEKVLLNTFKDNQQAKKYDCGFVAMKQIPESTQFNFLLEKVKLNRTFVIDANVESDGSKNILYLERCDDAIKHVLVTLSQSELSFIQQRMRDGKKFVFPKNDNEKFILRDEQLPLQNQEHELLMRARDREAHAAGLNFQNDQYPFDANVTMQQHELHKLKPSFMQRLVSAMQEHDGVHQVVKITGFPKIIFCDIENMRILSANENIYIRSPFSLFNNRIDRKALAIDRRKAATNLAEGRVGDTANVNSISLTVKRHQ